MDVCPLIFETIYKPRLWGGQRLGELLGKEAPAGATIGEAWELVDLDAEQSVVRTGPARGRRLHELLREWGAALLGTAQPIDGRFPLMVKFLDAREMLSVQVHPSRAEAARDGGATRPKHEMWYVLAAEPGAVIYRGLKPGVEREQLSSALRAGDVQRVLNVLPARPGDSYYLPAGTVHALGGGLVVAEVSTLSDTTYRLYDWERVDPATGAPRRLHVAEALACADFGPFDSAAEARAHVTSVWSTVTRLITSEAFVVERVRMAGGVEMGVPYADLVIWIVLEGRGEIGYKGARQGLAFGVGDVVVLPAALREGVLTTQADCMWLEVTLPGRAELGASMGEGRGSAVARPPAAKYVPLNLPRASGKHD